MKLGKSVHGSRSAVNPLFSEWHNKPIGTILWFVCVFVFQTLECNAWSGLHVIWYITEIKLSLQLFCYNSILHYLHCDKPVVCLCLSWQFGHQTRLRTIDDSTVRELICEGLASTFFFFLVTFFSTCFGHCSILHFVDYQLINVGIKCNKFWDRFFSGNFSISGRIGKIAF